VIGLPRRRPSQAGVDPAALLGLVDALDASPHELHSLMVLRHGDVVAEGWWAPYRPEVPHLLYSLSKSFTSAAVGFAIDEGLFGLDDPLVDHLGVPRPDPLDDRVAAMTVRHALTMTTGHAVDPLLSMFGWILEHPGADWLDGFLALPPDHDPGWPFTYNQFATYSLARIVEHRSGGRLLDYLRPRLLDPLGIDDARWISVGGHDVGFSGLHVVTEAIAAFGQLHLDDGRWQGRQVLPAGWVAEATRVQVPNGLADRGAGDQNADPDWNAGYGYQFWMCRHGYRGDGAAGQFCIVWPDRDVVVVTTATAPAMQDLLELIEASLVDAFPDAVPGDDPAVLAAEAALTDRLGSLALPPVPVADAADVAFGPVERVGGGAAPTVTGVRADRFDGGWNLVLDLPDGPAVIPAGEDRWLDGVWPGAGSRPGQPTAASAAVHRDGSLRAEIVLLQTPHRILVTADPTGATLDWNEFPLHGSDPADFVPR
jgi:CubicO group peptidase (beta-lactamase class C family)